MVRTIEFIKRIRPRTTQDWVIDGVLWTVLILALAA